MREFLNLLKQDLLVSWRNGFFAVILLLGVGMVLLVNFALPEQAKVGAAEYIVDLTNGRLVRSSLEERLGADAFLQSEAEAREVVESKRNALAIVFRGDRDNPGITILHQGNEPPKAINALEAALQITWLQVADLGYQKVHEQVILRPDLEKPPFSKSMLPLLMGLEVVMLGFAFISVLVFQEKAEGSIKAYRVSPRGAWLYIWSKSLAMVLISVVYALIITVPTIGLNLQWGSYLLLVALTSLLMTMLGLFIAAWFDTLSEFIFPMVGVFAVIGLPAISYLMPSFQLPIISAIPAYPLMFGLREIMFPTGKTGFLLPLLITLVLETVVISLLTRWAVEKRLMREGY